MAKVESYYVAPLSDRRAAEMPIRLRIAAGVLPAIVGKWAGNDAYDEGGGTYKRAAEQALGLADALLAAHDRQAHTGAATVTMTNAKPVAWMRKWAADGVDVMAIPKGERPRGWNMKDITVSKLLTDDVPLYANPSAPPAEPAEAVAWMYEASNGCEPECWATFVDTHDQTGRRDARNVRPLYLAPPSMAALGLALRGLVPAVQMLRQLGGMMPGTREVVMLAVEQADELATLLAAHGEGES